MYYLSKNLNGYGLLDPITAKICHFNIYDDKNYNPVEYPTPEWLSTNTRKNILMYVVENHRKGIKLEDILKIMANDYFQITSPIDLLDNTPKIMNYFNSLPYDSFFSNQKQDKVISFIIQTLDSIDYNRFKQMIHFNNWFENSGSYLDIQNSKGETILKSPEYKINFFKKRSDDRKDIISISFNNLLLVDIDESDITLFQIKKNRLIAKINSIQHLLNLHFILLNTDRGLHAYCVSHWFNPKSRLTVALLFYLNCDLMFILLTVKKKEFSVRISKKYNKKGEIISSDKVSFIPSHAIHYGSSKIIKYAFNLLQFKLKIQELFKSIQKQNNYDSFFIQNEPKLINDLYPSIQNKIKHLEMNICLPPKEMCKVDQNKDYEYNFLSSLSQEYNLCPYLEEFEINCKTKIEYINPRWFRSALYSTNKKAITRGVFKCVSLLNNPDEIIKPQNVAIMDLFYNRHHVNLLVAQDCSFIIKDKDEEPTLYKDYFTMSFQGFKQRALEINPNDRHFYEMINPFKMCKLYFDMDYKSTHIEEKYVSNFDAEKMLNYLKRKIKEVYQKLYNLYINEDDFIILDSSNFEKSSYHLILNNYPCVSLKHLRNLAWYIIDQIYQEKDSNIDANRFFWKCTRQKCQTGGRKCQVKDHWHCFIDEKVYTPWRQIRVLGSNKISSDRVLGFKTAKTCFKDTLLQVFDENKIQLALRYDYHSNLIHIKEYGGFTTTCQSWFGGDSDAFVNYSTFSNQQLQYLYNQMLGDLSKYKALKPILKLDEYNKNQFNLSQSELLATKDILITESDGPKKCRLKI